jgi:hypothetical protein
MLFVGYTFNSLSSTIECCAVEQENSKDIRHAQRKYKQKGKRSGRHKNIHTDMYFQPSQGRLFYPHNRGRGLIMLQQSVKRRSEPAREADGGLISCGLTDRWGLCKEK